jgi:hypothetical protein
VSTAELLLAVAVQQRSVFIEGTIAEHWDQLRRRDAQDLTHMAPPG